MFKPHYGTCVRCTNDNVLIAVKAGYCQRCNHELKQQAKKRYKDVCVVKPQKEPGQWEVFMEIWDEREHVSAISGTDLGDTPKAIFFSHLLSKGAFPRFKLKKENIWLVTAQEHMDWETGDRSHPKFKEKLKEYERLKQLYYATSDNNR